MLILPQPRPYPVTRASWRRTKARPQTRPATWQRSNFSDDVSPLTLRLQTAKFRCTYDVGVPLSAIRLEAYVSLLGLSVPVSRVSNLKREMTGVRREPTAAGRRAIFHTQRDIATRLAPTRTRVEKLPGANAVEIHITSVSRLNFLNSSSFSNLSRWSGTTLGILNVKHGGTSQHNVFPTTGNMLLVRIHSCTENHNKS